MLKRATALVVTLALLLTVSVTALAQHSSAQIVEGTPPPPKYALEEDGSLVIDGDQVIDCPSFARSIEQYGDAPPSDPSLQIELDEVREVLALCEQYGFVPTGASGAAYGYQYPSQNSMAADAEGAEGTTEAASGDPADAATLKSAVEAARADRTGGIAPAAASEAEPSRPVEEAAVAEEEDRPSSPEEDAGEGEDGPLPEGEAKEKQANASGDGASRGSASGGIDKLPATGGVSPALGAGALLLAGGLVARRIVK